MYSFLTDEVILYLTKMEPPKVKLHRTKEWGTDQPAHDILLSLPMHIAMLGP